jgi:hypothetical protein
VSLVSSRLALIHRCDVERDASAAFPDEWNTPSSPDWQPHLTELPCRSWTAGHETVSDKGTLTVVIEVHLLVPLGTDVTESDRVTAVTYRGATVQEGPLAVRAVLPRRDHLEVILSRAV